MEEERTEDDGSPGGSIDPSAFEGAAEGTFAAIEHPILLLAIPIVAIGVGIGYLQRRRRQVRSTPPRSAWSDEGEPPNFSFYGYGVRRSWNAVWDSFSD